MKLLPGADVSHAHRTQTDRNRGEKKARIETDARLET
jgi:hypothetical protein